MFISCLCLVPLNDFYYLNNIKAFIGLLSIQNVPVWGKNLPMEYDATKLYNRPNLCGGGNKKVIPDKCFSTTSYQSCFRKTWKGIYLQELQECQLCQLLSKVVSFLCSITNCSYSSLLCYLKYGHMIS